VIPERWKSLFVPPRQGDDEQNRIAGILHPTAMAILIGVGLLVLARISVLQMGQLLPLALVCGDMVATICLVRRGKLRYASLMMLWGVLLFLNYMVVSNDGIHDNALMAYTGVLVVAGLVLVRRQFYGFVAGCILSVAGVGILELTGLLQTPLSFKTSLFDVFDLMVIVVITSGAIGLFSNNLVEHIARARRGESDLRTQTERLRASEEKFNKAFHHTRVSMAIQDDSDRFMEINGTFCEITGFSGEEVLGNSGRSLNLWIEPAQSEQARLLLNREGHLRDFEIAFRTKAGEQRLGMMWAECIELEGAKCTLSTMLDITERKRAEDAVRRSDERFRSLFNSIDDAVFVHGLGPDGMPGRFLEVNDVACERLGYTRQELLTKSPADIDAAEGYALVPEAMRKLRATHHAVWEGTHVQKGGGRIPVEINNHLFDLEGKPTIIATVRDITDRKRMADRIRKSEEHYRTLVEMLPYAVLIIDPRGRITYASQKGYDVFAAPPGFDPRQTTIMEWVAEEDQGYALKRLKSIISGNEKPTAHEFRLKKYDGTGFWGEINASPLVDSAGVITGLLLVCRDISEYKRAEEQLLIKDSAIASSISAIGLADLNASIFFVNQAFVKLWGYTDAGQIIGRNIAEFAFLGEPETNGVVESMLHGGGYTAESVGVKADGSTFQIQLSANLVRSKEGKPICFMASFVDITERKVAENALRQSEGSLQAFINALPQPAFMMERNGTLLVANRSFAKSMGMRLSDLIGRGMYDLLPSAVASERERQIQRALKTRTSITFEDENAGGCFVNYIEPIVDPLGGADRVAVFALEITERKEIEKALQRSEQEYRGLFEGAHDAIVIFEPENEIVLDVNQRACELYGYPRNEFVGLSLHPLSQDTVKGREHVEQTLSQKRIEGMLTTHYRKDGSAMLLEINAAVVDYRGRSAIMSIERDVTERRRMERALKEQEEIYREAIAQADAVPYRSSYYPHEYVFLGEGIQRLTGYQAHEMTTEVWRGIVREIVMQGSAEGKTRSEAKQMALRGEIKQWRAHNRIIDRDGNTRWVADTAIQIFDPNGVPVGSVGILQDITDRKRWEEQILASLHEKEVLLKEIHHRVKNNLQVVSSLLNLQATHLKDEHVKSIFKESQNRIRSMALVHEYLYQSTDLSRIKFAAYVSRFLSEIVRSYSATLGRVQLRTDVGDVMLDIGEAIPCGLIINELVSNALKYAFPDRRKGEIAVRMRVIGDGEWELVVGDDGVGLPEGFKIGETQTLGMQLVDSFVRQLRGTLQVNRSKGTEFTIRFSSAGESSWVPDAGRGKLAGDSLPRQEH
jgi:PAS domain S-box-containing protein